MEVLFWMFHLKISILNKNQLTPILLGSGKETLFSSYNFIFKLINFLTNKQNKINNIK